MRVRKLPAPSKTSHVLFAATPLLAGSCQSRLFSIKLPRRRSVRGGALSYPFHLHLRQTTAFTSPLSRATAQALHPMPGCSDRAIRMQTGKSRPPGAGLLYRNVHPASHPIQKPTGVLSEQVSDCLDGKCAGGLLYVFFPNFIFQNRRSQKL